MRRELSGWQFSWCYLFHSQTGLNLLSSSGKRKYKQFQVYVSKFNCYMWPWHIAKYYLGLPHSWTTSKWHLLMTFFFILNLVFTVCILKTCFSNCIQINISIKSAYISYYYVSGTQGYNQKALVECKLLICSRKVHYPSSSWVCSWLSCSKKQHM